MTCLRGKTGSSNKKPGLKDLKRLIIIALFLFFLFTLLILQFYRIQIIEGDKWKKAAGRQHFCSVIEPHKRGLFYANTTLREGHPETDQPLVIDVARFHLYADPLSIPKAHKKVIADNIHRILGDVSPGISKLQEQLFKQSRSRKLVLWMKQEAQKEFLSWWQPYAKLHKIPVHALFFIQDYKRSYPFGKLLGQVLHTIRSEREPASYTCIPTGGLEFSLNHYLKGEDGKRVFLRSPKQHLDLGEVVKEPEHGSHVYLTIDHHLQAIAEEEIKKAVITAEAKSGWAVMMDPYTGEVLALAQYPFFEPEKYKDYFTDPVKRESALIKSITVPFEPGSTMKPITLAIALQANARRKLEGKPPLFLPKAKVESTPTLFPGRRKPLQDLSRHRYLNFDMALQKSSNVYMAKAIQKVVETYGDAWYRQMLEDVFGLGLKTGIELPAESPGLVPRPGKLHPNGRAEWSKSTPYSLAMGHNILTNTLQMVRSYAIFANGGHLVTPTLIKKITDHTGKVVVERPQTPLIRILDEDIVRQVINGMRYATKLGGTAKRADIPGYTEAGKTATSEKVVAGVYSKKDHISTFIGFAPIEQPKFVLSIVIDEPAYQYIPGVGKNQYGGVCAAPCFREIGLRALQYLGTPPDDPHNDAWMKEVNDLKKLYHEWNPA
ncbi:MAG: penicillin-binding protein 2 [Candidatus Rhabdochlamydia sp.]